MLIIKPSVRGSVGEGIVKFILNRFPEELWKEQCEIPGCGIVDLKRLLKENPNWSWNDALKYVKKSRLIYPAIEIKESILDYFESIEGHRRGF